MTDLVALSEHWATKQLDYASPRPFDGSLPRDDATQIYVHSAIARGLVVSLPESSATKLLHHLSAQVQTSKRKWEHNDTLQWNLVEDSIVALSQAFAHLGDYTTAIQLGELHDYNRDRVSTLADLAVYAFKQGRTEDVKMLMRTVQTHVTWKNYRGDQVNASDELIFCLTELGDITGAIESALSTSWQGGLARNHLFDFIMYLCNQGLFGEAEKVARIFNSQIDRGILLCEVSTAFALVNPKHSRVLIREVEKIASNLTEEKDRIRLYSALFVPCFHLGDQERFERYFSMATELAKSHIPSSIPSPLSDYIVALAKIGRAEDARHFADSIDTKEPGKQFIRQEIIEFHLARYFIDSQQYEDAHKTAKLLKLQGIGDWDSDLYIGTRILVILALKLTEDGQFDKAQKIIDEIIIQTRNSNTVELQVYYHYIITQLLARYQRYDEMFELLDKAGIDEFARAIASAGEHFEAHEKGLSLKMLEKIIRVGSQKYEDYNEFLPFINT